MALNQSGVTARRGRISRHGNKLTRTHLVTAATVLLCSIQAESSLRSWGLQLAKKIGFLKARVAVARKLAVLMITMWKTGEPFAPDYRRPRFHDMPTSAASLGSITKPMSMRFISPAKSWPTKEPKNREAKNSPPRNPKLNETTDAAIFRIRTIARKVSAG